MIANMRDHAPRVTVLLPVYNAETYLNDAIQSILQQTFPDFELLAINDGSTDGSREILKSIKDTRLIVVENDTNCGIIEALNKGLKLAKGEFVARMDADDIAVSERLERQVRFFDEHPNVALVGGGANLMDDKGMVFGVCKVPLSYSEILERIFSVNCFIHPSVMMRRKAIQTIGGYDRDAQHAEDYDLWLRILENHPVENLPDILLHYRIHPNQISQRKLYVQRLVADRVRFAAYKRCKEKGIVSSRSVPSRVNLWGRLQGKPLSVGGDFCYWINLYYEMGRYGVALRMALSAIVSAPLCGYNYKIICRIVARLTKASYFVNLARWYVYRVKSYFCSHRT